MIDHEWISIQGVIGRVFQIGRTRIFCLFTLLHVVNARIYVERRTKKRPEFQIGIKLSTHFMSFFFFFFLSVLCLFCLRRRHSNLPSVSEKNIANGTFIPSLFSCRSRLWVSVRLKSLLIFSGNQTRMGACQIVSVRAVQFQKVIFHIHYLILWAYIRRRT